MKQDSYEVDGCYDGPEQGEEIDNLSSEIEEIILIFIKNFFIFKYFKKCQQGVI
jgi:hypothetical protein